MELIDVKGLMQRVNLNYNNNQMISVSALKDIINTQPKVSLEEISNPCIECSQNCCVCELNGEKCECQKIYVVKENKQ